MLRRFFITLFTTTICFFTAFPTLAQDESRAILVLDASGSMWGQIEGVAKITIAQQVVGNLLNTLPQSQLLGLTAYGHRRKGDCSDIETLHLPGVDRATIAATVNSLSPRGKTPLSAAVLQAAEALKYTENAATVILISDGIETCNLDPCAIGRQLEETGVDFTAHVIGFDVSDPIAQAQLQCLAHETGGTYLPADNAGELADALQEMAEAPVEPVGIPVTVTFRAIEGEGGPVINTDLVWTMGTDTAGILYENEFAGQISHELMAGIGEVNVLRTTDEASAHTQFIVSNGTIADGNMLITLVLPKLIPNATLLAADEAVAGALIPVTWSGPAGEHDYLTSAELGMANVVYVEYVKTRDSEGDVAMLRMPPKAGLYEIRYIENTSREVLARRNIQVTPLTIELDAPAQANAGSTIQVGWTGPDYKDDFLSVAKIGADGRLYENYTYLRDGNPTSLLMPAEPGIYEIRYVLNASRTVAGSVNIEVVEVLATLDAVDAAPAGSVIDVTWTGPDYERDYITITEIGARDAEYGFYSYTEDGSPVPIKLPLEVGQYELRYVADQDKTVLARRVINVSPVSATLEAPTSAAAGSSILVGWTGPAYERDYISVAEIGSPSNEDITYEYTRDGALLNIRMPSEPGEYELRYIAYGSPSMILARQTISIESVSASLEAPASAAAGSSIVINWQGPGEERDHITIAKPGESVSDYESFTYTHDGSPLSLQMPTEPGEYELRYVLDGSDDVILARVPITVEAVSATIDAPATAPVGSQLVLNWQGPGEERDHITIAKPGEGVRDYESYTYTRDGNPLTLQMPNEPGEYELRYVLDGTVDVILTRVPITIETVTARIKAPPTAPAGSTLILNWQGPDEDRDHITIAKALDAPHTYETYTYTREGSPLTLQMPSEPGDYELRYILQGTDRTILVRSPITVTAVSATLDAPASAVAGSEIIITWTGPEGPRDHLTVAVPTDNPGKYESFVYVRDGNPLRLRMPTTPGEYELRYIAQGTERDAIMRQMITITAASATLDAPNAVPAGSILVVNWTGPENHRDHISIAEVGDTAGQYETYTYVREGNPLSLQIPTTPGTYELRYIIQGTDRSVLESQTLVVEPVTATLKAEASVAAGGNLVVAWEGPDYRNDYIGISKPGDLTGYETYTYTKDGNPLIVKAPDAPGTYELRYVINRDSVTIGRQTLVVE